MSQYALRLPNSLMQTAKKLAEKDDVSLNQLFVLAIAEKLSALETSAYFEKRAARADPKKLDSILAKLPQTRTPDSGDELPARLKRAVSRRTSKA